MFPLHTPNFPSSATDLGHLLNESLQHLFIIESEPVTVRARSYPHLDSIDISLDRAQLRANPPRSPLVLGETSPALEVDQVILTASPLSLGLAAVNLSLSARGVLLRQAKDPNDQIVLSFQGAAEGNLAISATPADLETLISKLAEVHATKQGVTIDGVQLTLRQKSPQSVAVEIRLRVRKLFFSASIQVTGQLELDDELNLKISSLDCTGDGGIATLACGILKPYLEKIDGRKLSLVSLPLGEIRLRDVRLIVSDKISVTAEFGSTL